MALKRRKPKKKENNTTIKHLFKNGNSKAIV
jgi:hypothetical protein